MDRIPVIWAERPDEEDEFGDSYLIVSLQSSWVAVDQDQLVCRVELVERDGTTLDEPEEALLKQYGGEGLLNQMLMSDQDVEQGSWWSVHHDEVHGVTIEPVAGGSDS